MQNSIVWGNKIFPILNNQFLPVFPVFLRTVAIPSDILMKKMRVGNNPSIEIDFECVVGDHPLIIFGDFRFLYRELARERPDRVFLPGRSRRVLRGMGNTLK